MQQHVVQQLVLFEFALSQTGGEMRTVDRDVEVLQKVWQRTEMIFVTMSEDDGGDVVPVLFEKAKIRNRNIHAVSCFLGKTHPGVENQHLVAVPHRHAIHSELADTTERDDLEDASHKLPEYSMYNDLARMTYLGFHLYYPRYDQVSTGPAIPFPVCGRGGCCDPDDAAGLLPHGRCVAGSFQRRSHRD